VLLAVSGLSERDMHVLLDAQGARNVRGRSGREGHDETKIVGLVEDSLEPPRCCNRQPLKLVDLLCRRKLTRILRTDVERVRILKRTHTTTLFAQIRTRHGSPPPYNQPAPDDIASRHTPWPV
jgi:hypothetical protein